LTRASPVSRGNATRAWPRSIEIGRASIRARLLLADRARSR
jgi:hypothetical protein